ncbi:hypothetical protein CC78DRAFT_533285 [Lojkania enalia]|uniref:Ryanodine receptor Ryr domain-containing protein n=1 Tax=Lojkania enalia TaxID=147567 RepID=A0A9P4N031_9PLEO|nr:hypothetical protein CC78DRAFT_533285 [Didymosphaeria enalia]
MSLSRELLIAGAAPQDLFLFPDAQPTSDQEASSPRTVWFKGGAGLVHHLLKPLEQSIPKVEIHAPEFKITSWSPSSLIELSDYTINDSGQPTFTPKHQRRLENNDLWDVPQRLPPYSHDKRTVLVYQDGGSSVAKKDSRAFSSLIESRSLQRARPELSWPDYFIYHMSRPLCEGHLWDNVRPSPRNKQAGWDPERLVVVVRADDLRAEGIQLSHGLSWEKTCEDFVKQLGSVGKLVTLVTCPHLIVLFGCDGVIYHRGLEVAEPILFFDPLRSEGQFYRENLKDVPGVMEAFVAGFAKEVVWANTVDYEKAVKAGFRASRGLSRRGISKQDKYHSLYDTQSIMGKFNNNGRTGWVRDHQIQCADGDPDALIRFDIPSDGIGAGDENSWSLLDDLVGDPAEIARKIVTEGTHSAKIEVPLRRFNQLELFDRKEIELFQTLFNGLDEYLATPQTKPLSIAFFGPRGSGKSFAALQVAESAFAGRHARQLRFDLSQFKSQEDLVEAFHRVRDCTLEGFIPLVYFNNFDADFNGSQFGWLPYLLPVLSSGRFSSGGVDRPIGSGVFFFGANATKTYAHLQRFADKLSSTSNPKSVRAVREFLGCLQGFVNMVGFNRISTADRLYPLRRAVALRALLAERAPGLKSGNRINIDESVLNALLIVPEYRQGIRSLSSILGMCRLNNERHFQRAALPPHSQLELHVKYEDFKDAMRGFPVPKEIRDLLAERLNQAYIDHKRRTELSKPENRGKSQEQIDVEHFLKPWDRLEENYRESNREHADAIPEKLCMIYCFLSERKDNRKPVTSFTEEEIDVMAQAEKARWNSERLQRQWRTGKRSANQRTTPFLMPWEDLDEEVKDLDRILVRSYPDILPEDYAIYRMGPIG